MKTPVMTKLNLVWWIAFSSVIVGGLVMRWLTIDRNTPGLGALVYAGLLGVLFIAIALPTSFIAAFAWHRWRRRLIERGVRVATWLRALRAKAALQPMSFDARVRCVVIAVAALLAFVVSIASGRLPPWHVWLSAVLSTSLVAGKLFAWVLAQLRADAASQPCNSHPLRTESCDVAIIANAPDATANGFASDDRNFRARWRARCLNF